MAREDKIKIFSIKGVPLKHVRKGIKGTTIVVGSNIQLNYYEVDPGAETPEHSHPQEIIGLTIKGEYEAILNGKVVRSREGEGYYIPANAMHGPFKNVGSTKAVSLDFISPLRDTEPYREEE